jgi:hypothetical protein
MESWIIFLLRWQNARDGLLSVAAISRNPSEDITNSDRRSLYAACSFELISINQTIFEIPESLSRKKWSSGFDFRGDC